MGKARGVRAVPLALAVVIALVGCGSAAVPLPAAASAAPVTPAVPQEITGPVDTALTGVPAGSRLTVSRGLSITEPGTVIEGLDVRGCIDVLADDVTVRNTRVRCTDPDRVMVVRVGEGARRLVIESSELDGGGKVDIGIGWGDYTLRRVDVHGVVDGARFGHRVTVEESWIHDMARIGSLHPDALQTTSATDVVIRGNVLDPTRRGDDGGEDLNNAALMLGSETGTQEVRDVLVEHNRLDGGNYSLNVRGDITAESLVIRDNVFGDGARYGPVIGPSSVPLGDGNVMVSGGPVDVDRAR